MRTIAATFASAVLLAACGGSDPAPGMTSETVAPAPTLPESAPDPTTLPPQPPQADRIGAMMLSCGGEQFRVAFNNAGATQVNDDGSNNDLPLLSAGPDTEPGVSVYSDGRVSFAKQGGGDTATSIRFARGRMGWVDCAIAQN